MPFAHAQKIPEELRRLPQWITWRGEPKADGTVSKVPYIPGLETRASSTASATWRDFDTASKEERIGFVFSKDDPYCGIDLDHTRDPTTEVWLPTAIGNHSELLFQLFQGAYIEVSPSGEGFHLICRGKSPEHHKHTFADKSGIEIYDQRRYFTMTGDVVQLSNVLTECQEGIDWLYTFFDAPHTTGESQYASSDGGGEGFASLAIALDSEAHCDPTAWKLLCGKYPRAVDVYSRKVKMPHDSSASGYDQALCNYGALMGWSPQDICNLLIACRVHHGDSLKFNNLQYYQRTIWRALQEMQRNQALEDLPLVDSASKGDCLAIMQKLTGLKIARYIQSGKSEAALSIILHNRGKYELGAPRQARDQERWRDIAAQELGVEFRRLTPHEWEQCRIALGTILERQDTEEEVFLRTFKELLYDYIDKKGYAGGATFDTILHGAPFRETDCWHVNLAMLYDWFDKGPSKKTPQQLMSYLRMLDAVPLESPVKRKQPHSKAVEKRYWRLPASAPVPDPLPLSPDDTPPWKRQEEPTNGEESQAFDSQLNLFESSVAFFNMEKDNPEANGEESETPF